MNFKTRYLVETIKTDGTREFAVATNDSAAAEASEAALLSLGMSAVVTDRALQHKASTPAGARARGYYGMRYSGDDRLNYIIGGIERSADDALDDLDDLVQQKELEFENRHRASWVAADQSVILWAGLGKVAA